MVLGAPNALKGESLYGRLSAREAVSQGVCSVLASDYCYHSLVHAAFLLHRLDVCPFPAAWNLISAQPAHAAGLEDRGSLRNGMRADLVLVDDSNPDMPRVIATFVGGELAYADRFLDSACSEPVVLPALLTDN